MSRRRLLRRYAVVAALAMFALIGVVLSPDAMLDDAVELLAGPLFLPAVFVAALVRPFLAWPLSLLSVAVGYVLGFPAGVPVVLAVTVVTCLPPFVLAARFDAGGGLLGRLSRVGADAVAVTGGVRGVTAARLAPVPADAVSYAAGLAGVSVPAFVVGTAVGEFPWALFYVLLGASIGDLSTSGVTTADAPVTLFAAAALAALLLVAGPLYRALS